MDLTIKRAIAFPMGGAIALRSIALTLEFVVSAVFASGTLRAYYEPSLSQWHSS
ncbi:MAG: hypothetical protein RIE73_05435 [Coleofasciculus sp. C1-SOL-03]|uniref:hypothetical protein n=1 Tax=Coleofasciculus sp. C1-SOL-03 TaxID=3069522 RepID=UPI00330279A9